MGTSPISSSTKKKFLMSFLKIYQVVINQLQKHEGFVDFVTTVNWSLGPLSLSMKVAPMSTAFTSSDAHGRLYYAILKL